MELNFIRELLGRTKGVDGYVVMDLKGAVLTQDLGTYANEIKRTEFATWILNSFYAVDSYYPQAFCLLFHYSSGHIYLTRTDNRLITVMCRHGADLFSIENAFSKHRNAMGKSNTSGVVREKSNKGETVFLKISETGSGATSSPIPQKKSGPSVGLLIGAIVAVCGVIGVVAFTMNGKKAKEPTQDPASLAQNEQPEAKLTPTPTVEGAEPKVEQFSESTAAIAHDRSAALAKIAQQQNSENLDPMNMARATASNQSAMQKFNAGDYEQAIELWNQSASSYGKAAVTASEKNFSEALRKAGLTEISNYPSSAWINVETLIKDAKEKATQGNYTDAVAAITEQSTRIPQLKKEFLAKLSNLATSAAKSNNVENALKFYQMVVAVDPNNKVARDYIYRNRYKPGEIITNTVGMKFAYIPPGEFTRGSPETEAYRDADEIQAKITITKGFFIVTTEVSQEQWEKVMGQRMRMEDPDSDFIGRTLPVHSITWAQAQEFCRRLSEIEGKTYRLPTEAEWEYAARAGTTTPYNNGKDRLTSREANIYDPSGEGLDSIAAVGSIGQPNQWGLYDIHGNVAEWTADWSAPYPDGPQVDPAGPEDSEGRIDLAMKVVRGGSCIDDAYLTRTANRSESSPVVANSYTGFRPVLVLADI